MNSPSTINVFHLLLFLALSNFTSSKHEPLAFLALKGAFSMKSDARPMEIPRLEAALARQTDLVDKILLISDNPMYIFDFRQGMFRILNRLPFSFAGYTSEQVATLSPDTLMALLHPEDKPRVLDHYQDLRMAREGEVLELEFRLRHSYGNWHWVSVRETPFERSANDEVHSILGGAEGYYSRADGRGKSGLLEHA
jgi:PAS domain S-box-containing protein